ncbi:MAG: hypothetical protein A2033_13935 [Bacteroidetes bacterium GWA2_31_9]|nr:MAG: hypothetical protein A2033_13935 [Bacteroidetes bacterium GWA2_31_9]
MGLFSRKEKAKDYVRLLKEIGIDFFGLSHDNFKPTEISIEAETAGVIKSSHGELGPDIYFDTVLLSDKSDGSRDATFLKDEADERELKKTIENLFSIFGDDSTFYGTFEMRDISVIRGKDPDKAPDDNLREWNTFYKNGFHYTVSISYDLKDKTIYLCVNSKKTWAIYDYKPRVPTQGYKK